MGAGNGRWVQSKGKPEKKREREEKKQNLIFFCNAASA